MDYLQQAEQSFEVCEEMAGIVEVLIGWGFQPGLAKQTASSIYQKGYVDALLEAAENKLRETA